MLFNHDSKWKINIQFATPDSYWAIRDFWNAKRILHYALRITVKTRNNRAWNTRSIHMKEMFPGFVQNNFYRQDGALNYLASPFFWTTSFLFLSSKLQTNILKKIPHHANSKIGLQIHIIPFLLFDVTSINPGPRGAQLHKFLELLQTSVLMCHAGFYSDANMCSS